MTKPKKKATTKKAVKKNVAPVDKKAPGKVPQYIDKEEISAFFGLSIRQIERWEADGCPVDRSGRKNVYDLRKVFDWRFAQIQKNNLTELDLEKLRETSAKADIKELEVQERIGNLLPLDLIMLAWSGILSNVKAAFRGLVSDYRVYDPKVSPEKLEFLKKRINFILSELSNENPIPRKLLKTLDEYAQEFNAPAEPDAK